MKQNWHVSNGVANSIQEIQFNLQVSGNMPQLTPYILPLCLQTSTFFSNTKTGDKGESGDFGLQGAPGPQGLKGDTGFPGAHGEVGDFGLQGEIGQDGRPGKR